MANTRAKPALKRKRELPVPAGSTNRLLDAAEKVIAARGYEGASIRSIAAKAKVNSSLIQYHFGGKSGLYEAVIERRMLQAKSVFTAAASMVESASGMPLNREVVALAVKTLLGNFSRLVHSNKDFHRIMRREQAADLPVARKVLLRLMPLEPLALLIERAQREKLIRPDIPPRLIASVIFGVHQHCHSAAPMFRELIGLDPDDPPSLNELVEVNYRLLFESLWMTSS